jgi:signal transduction histidine kinase
MAPSPRSRLDGRPGAIGVALLVLTLILAAGLGWQATRAAASHRRTAEKTLRDYAAIAAWEYAREGRIWLSFGMAEAENMISREIPPPGKGTLPGTDLLRRVLKEKECDCMSAGFARTVFRIVAGAAPVLEVDGEALSEAARAGITGLLVHDSVPPRGPRRWRMLPPGYPALNRPDDTILLWKAAGVTPEGPPRAIYGMVVEAAQIHRPLLGAAGDATLLPPSLTSDPGSLMVVSVLGPSGVPIYASDTASGPVFEATDTLGWVYGDLAVRAAVKAGAASTLLVGGLPASRLPQTIALLVLTLVLGTGALLLLRREQQLARLRDDFVSSVSHELRTPLTQIRVMGELLADNGFKSEPEAERAREVIRREALRLTNLVDNVLQFARMRRGPQALAARTLPLGEVITEACEALVPLSASRRVTLDVQVRDDIRVVGDRDAVVQILRNLLENAIKYGPEGQTVRVAAEAGEGVARVAVEDQGPGVPASERERIWQPYQRLARDRKAAGAGTGLGLSVVAELARLLRGRAWVEDATGGGARFVVEVPVGTVETVGGSR